MTPEQWLFVGVVVFVFHAVTCVIGYQLGADKGRGGMGFMLAFFYSVPGLIVAASMAHSSPTTKVNVVSGVDGLMKVEKLLLRTNVLLEALLATAEAAKSITGASPVQVQVGADGLAPSDIAPVKAPPVKAPPVKAPPVKVDPEAAKSITGAGPRFTASRVQVGADGLAPSDLLASLEAPPPVKVDRPGD